VDGRHGRGLSQRPRDTKLGRDVAIKVLPELLADDTERLARLQREAKTLASLNHPNIGSIYGLEEAMGVTALVLELIEGLTLADRIEAGPIPLAEALTIARQIAETLEAAHEQGIIHRDIKPANIKIVRTGLVKVLDFGLAKVWDGTQSSDLTGLPALTATGNGEWTLLGTPAYMSPEQARGEPLDRRTDVWSFGCVLYEMLAGTRAFGGAAVSEVLADVMKSEPSWMALPPETPAPLRTLLRRCLAKDPRHRRHDIADVRLALEDAVETAAMEATTIAVRRLRLWQRPALLATGVMALLGVTMLGLSSFLLRPGTIDAGPPTNRRPVIVLMDSPLPGRVYDARTLAAGGTNADDVSDALRDLEVVNLQGKYEPMWHREEQVRGENPDLIISHLSSLYDVRMAKADEETAANFFHAAETRLTLFFGYLSVTNPRARFLVYSRGQFATKESEEVWLGDVISRFPRLKGRLFLMPVPGGSESATFRDPATAELLRTHVRAILALL
jgi:hypothetical protein